MSKTLIIEDDKDASLILADLVRDRGFEPIQSHSGEEGLGLARSIRPELIFLDVMLPDLDGYKICEALKLDKETNPIPIIMVTALTAETDRVQGFRVGADAYVTKPYTTDDIAAAIDAALAHREHLKSKSAEMHIHFDVASEIENLQNVNELFGVLLHNTTLSERAVIQLRTALLEMGSNAIEWGNRHDPNKLVRVTTQVRDDCVEIQIADEGGGFDPGNLPHASDGGEDPTRHFPVRQMLGLRDGGFGILITKGLVDDVHYNAEGNIVTLIKRMG
ncbi:MAG: ATP-binding protein [Planctomycetota bacterium]